MISKEILSKIEPYPGLQQKLYFSAGQWEQKERVAVRNITNTNNLVADCIEKAMK